MTRVAFAAVSVTLLILTLLLFPPIATSGDLGICLPSPNQWHLPRFLSWLINTVLLVLSVEVMAMANKKYNFIPETRQALPAAMAFLLACNSIPTAALSTSTLLLLCNALCLFILLSTYEEPNATREFFIMGTLPAIGAMVQYGFLWMIPVYAGGGLLMKSFRLREFIAFIFGLLAPYWIAVGLGLVSPAAFRLPDVLTVFNGGAVESDIFITVLTAGIMAFLGFIFSLYNGVRLFSRNSRLRCMHMAINVMGYVAVLAVIFDFNNFVAYIGTIALWLALELATLLHLYNVRHQLVPLLLMAALFLPLYILTL